MDTTAFPAHLVAQIDKILATCRAQMTEGTVPAVTYVLHTGSQTVVPVEMHMPNTISKDIAASMVRWTAKNIEADATIMVSEAWSLPAADMGRYQEILEEYGSIGEYPGRLDILMVNVQTKEGSWIGRALIETRGKARRCGELEVLAVPEAEAQQGRSGHFLPEKDK